MAFRWRAVDDPLIVVFGSPLPPPHKAKKNFVIVGPPLTKFSGSAHDIHVCDKNTRIYTAHVQAHIRTLLSRPIHARIQKVLSEGVQIQIPL